MHKVLGDIAKQTLTLHACFFGEKAQVGGVFQRFVDNLPGLIKLFEVNIVLRHPQAACQEGPFLFAVKLKEVVLSNKH